METISIFLPAKKGSQRVASKNTRPFYRSLFGLIQLKLDQVCNFVKEGIVDEIVLSTNDDFIVDLCKWPEYNQIKLNLRPENLCLDTTKAEDIMKYAAKVCKGDTIMLIHCTSPFVTAKDYIDAIETYKRKRAEGYDSLVAVMPIHNFLLDENGFMINNDQSKGWPRTQDLKPVYEVNHSIFIAPRCFYEEKGDKVGNAPYLYKMSKIKSMDIDWEDDFTIAEAIAPKVLQ